MSKTCSFMVKMGKNRKKSEFLGNSKMNQGTVFWMPIKNRITGSIFYLFFLIDVTFYPLLFTIEQLFTNYGPFVNYKRKTGKSPKISRLFGHQKLISNQNLNFLIGRLFLYKIAKYSILNF